ncbi:hypothetical protein [Sunxiuqinia dokdonensis]|nr:hypothetical protein [Sunxiuqinia dokdonensis]
MADKFQATGGSRREVGISNFKFQIPSASWRTSFKFQKLKPMQQRWFELDGSLTNSHSPIQSFLNKAGLFMFIGQNLF